MVLSWHGDVLFGGASHSYAKRCADGRSIVRCGKDFSQFLAGHGGAGQGHLLQREAQRGSARKGEVRHGFLGGSILAWRGRAGHCEAGRGNPRQGGVRQCGPQYGKDFFSISVRYGYEWLGPAQHGASPLRAAFHSSALLASPRIFHPFSAVRRRSAGHCVVEHRSAKPGMVRCCVTLHGIALLGRARLGCAWLGWVVRGTALQGMDFYDED